MTQTIINGSNKTTQDQYTGPENEITADQSNRNLRLHDGSKPGGYTILSQDNSDARYQAKSQELDGLIAFEPQQRGILVRLGPADYRLRSLVVNLDNLTLENANGYTGNPTISLAPTIESEHRWNAQQIFSDVCEFESGINADLTGDTYGQHVGNVVGNVTGNLTGNSIGNHVGPVDVRGATLQLDAKQIPVSAINGLLAYTQANAFPIGGIILWSGSVDSIPAGWVLCDGNNGTPDLTSKFVLGAGGAYAVGAAGGTTIHSHTITVGGSGAHDHGITVQNTALSVEQLPAHSHKVAVAYESGNPIDSHPNDPVAHFGTYGKNVEYILTAGAGSTWLGPSESKGSGNPHNHGVSLSADGSHAHTGSSASANNLPPYYALCYIMRS